jgi:hypothetical protein
MAHLQPKFSHPPLFEGDSYTLTPKKISSGEMSLTSPSNTQITIYPPPHMSNSSISTSSISSGPFPPSTKLPKKTSAKPAFRKAGSGPAISPYSQARRARSRSPSFQMPKGTPAPFLVEPYNPREAIAPRPLIAAGPSRRETDTKTNSSEVSMHQTSVVDSIAQTMVGEWMYKYVRRPKSFRVLDKPDWDAKKSVGEISQSVTNSGVRHKRWVWLAPYERAVMWSSKQPTSGTALMGKSGRKCKLNYLHVKGSTLMFLQ